MFYPEIKTHISPSALDAWHNSRGGFVKSYFAGVKFKGNASTLGGRRIHALIESGMLDVKKNYSCHEDVIAFAFMEDGTHRRIQIDEDGEYDFPVGAKIVVYGIPDSHEFEPEKKEVSFVDYKSGRAQTWSDEKLATDLKMKTTAWLVWKLNAEPNVVVGHIEYIPTQWNEDTREIEPADEETIVAGTYRYSAEELASFGRTILDTVDQVNEGYQEWLESTNDFIDAEDVARFAELESEIKKLSEEKDRIKELIAEQMKVGKSDSYTSVFGSFYFSTKKKWEYPEEITQEIANAAAKKKRFETENKPVEITKSLGFRAKKK